MKIIWITPESPYPPRNGVRVKCYNIVETLKYKHQFHIVYLSNTDEVYKSENVKTTKIENFEKFKKFRIFGMSNEEKRLYKKLKNLFFEKYDLIVIDTIKLWYILKYPFIDKSKVVFYLTDSYSLTLRDRRKYSIDKSFKNYIKYLYYSILEKRIIKLSKWVLVVSSFDKNYLVKKYSKDNFKNILVVPNGVNTDYYVLDGAANQHNSIGYIGSMGEGSSYCLWFLKNVFPSVVLKNASVKFYIIGRSPSEELINYSKNFNNIIITGEVEDIRPYATLCDIIVSPVLKTHGILNKTLESFSMGKPVVGTEVSFNGIKHGENNKHFISCKDSKSMSESILNLLNDSEKINEIGKNAKELVNEYYTWKKIFGNFFESL